MCSWSINVLDIVAGLVNRNHRANASPLHPFTKYYNARVRFNNPLRAPFAPQPTLCGKSGEQPTGQGEQIFAVPRQHFVRLDVPVRRAFARMCSIVAPLQLGRQAGNLTSGSCPF